MLVDRDGPAADRWPRSTGAPRWPPPGPRHREHEHGLPVRRLVGELRLVEVPVVGDEARDVDTWEDLRDLTGPTRLNDLMYVSH